MREHFARWSCYFGSESWWEMYQALYDGPGHDWEGASTALDQIAYQLAKARGLDTTQTCPSCRKVVDEIPTLMEWQACSACEAAKEARRAAERRAYEAQQELERIARENMLARMTPGQRAAFLERERKAFTGMRYGLISRDVQ